METGRNDLLGELARDAELERNAFIGQASEQLRKFLEANRGRTPGSAGLVLIDEDPDYLSVAPDLRSAAARATRTRSPASGSRDGGHRGGGRSSLRSITRARILAAFAEAAREQAACPTEPTATNDLMDAAGIGAEETGAVGEDPATPRRPMSGPRGQAADLGRAPPTSRPRDGCTTLHSPFQERSQHSEARLIEQFEGAHQGLPVIRRS